MDRIFSLATLASLLLQASPVTITLDDQKNGQMDAVMHDKALPNNPLCPCRAAARQFVSMHIADPNNSNEILSIYALRKQVSATQMAGGTRKTAFLRSMLWLQGYDWLRICPHSLPASSAMQLKLDGVSDALIQRRGPWTSTTWLQYLHSQISCLTRGLSTRMATPVFFFKVGTCANN